MPFDVVGLERIGFDERDSINALVAAQHVQHRHAAAARTDLEEVGQRIKLLPLRLRPRFAFVAEPRPRRLGRGFITVAEAAPRIKSRRLRMDPEYCVPSAQYS